MMIYQPVNRFKPVAEAMKNYPRMSTDEIRQNVQRMRNKANLSIERMQQSGYYSSALESREKKLRKEGDLHYKSEYFRSQGYDLRFKAGERNKDPELERARLVKESRELTKFLGMSTRTVTGVKNALDKMQEHPVVKQLSEGMTPEEMSFKFKDIFNMADDIKKLYEDHGLDPSGFGELNGSFIPLESQVTMSEGEKDRLINLYIQQVRARYESIQRKFAQNDARLDAMFQRF